MCCCHWVSMYRMLAYRAEDISKRLVPHELYVREELEESVQFDVSSSVWGSCDGPTFSHLPPPLSLSLLASCFQSLCISSSTSPSLSSLHTSSYHLPHCPIMTASLSPSHLSPPSSFLPVFSTLLLPFMQAQVAEMCILTWMKSFVKPVLMREQQRQRRLTRVSSWFICT